MSKIYSETPAGSGKLSETDRDTVHAHSPAPRRALGIYKEELWSERPRKMLSSVTILSTPTADTAGTSIILTLDDKKYLFGNVHEGLQRVGSQNSTRLGKIQHVFLTGKTEWKTTGGLIGFILTIADVMQTSAEAARAAIHQLQENWEKKLAETKRQDLRDQMLKHPQPKDKLANIQVPRLNIFGGDNVMQLLATGRRFIFRKGLPLDIHEFADTISSQEPTWEDRDIQVWALPLQPYNDSTNLKISPMRKRSYDEYRETPLIEESSTTPLSRTQQLKGVISDMFESDWKMDALFETPLADVKLPAAMFVRNPETRQLEDYRGPMPGTDQDISGIKVLVRKPWPGALISYLPQTRPSPVSMSYIVKNKPRRGSFNPILAAKFGLKPGPAYRSIANGQSVVNDKGETITSDQVTGKLRNGRGFAVIEIPSLDYIPSLKSASAFNDHDIMEDIKVIFWLLGPGITNSTAFQELVKQYPDRQHIISSSDHCANYLSIDSAAKMQLQHREIDQERFCIPLHDNAPYPLPTELSDCVIAHRGIEMILEPDLKFSAKMEPSLCDTVKAIEMVGSKLIRTTENTEMEVNSLDFQEQYNSQQLPSGDTEIITIGTGSSTPSKHRNVSATLIRVPNVGSYLLDAGENTIGQLSRMYSSEELKELLQDLKLVWISHLHADHHLGLASIIKAWRTAVYGDNSSSQKQSVSIQDQILDPAKYLVDEQKLCVVSETEMLHWLQEYSQIEDFGYDKILPLRVLPAKLEQLDIVTRPTKLEWYGKSVGFQVEDAGINAAIRKATGLSDLQAVYVTHCAGARAVALTWPSGLKISYSGDCRPSRRFATIGKDSTVLIHEATFDDTLAGDAKAKRHSTTHEAIAVGLEMKAKRIILTHFSQRYSKVPEMENVVARSVNFEDPGMSTISSTSETNHISEPAEPLESVAESTSDLPAAATETESDAQPISPEYRMQHPSIIMTESIPDVKIGVAFDLMRVKIKDIIIIDKYKRVFKKLYFLDDEPDPAKLARVAEAEATRLRKEEEKKRRQERHRHNNGIDGEPEPAQERESIQAGDLGDSKTSPLKSSQTGDMEGSGIPPLKSSQAGDGQDSRFSPAGRSDAWGQMLEGLSLPEQKVDPSGKDGRFS